VRLLEHAGYDVLEAEDGRAAYEVICEAHSSLHLVAPGVTYGSQSLSGSGRAAYRGSIRNTTLADPAEA
jgi:CheY-like chemotaxis protein